MRCGERHLRRQWRPYHEGHRMLQFDDRLVRSLGRRLEGLPEGGRRDLRGPRRAVRWVWRIFHEGESLLRGGGQVRCGQPVLLQVRHANEGGGPRRRASLLSWTCRVPQRRSVIGMRTQSTDLAAHDHAVGMKALLAMTHDHTQSRAAAPSDRLQDRLPSGGHAQSVCSTAAGATRELSRGVRIVCIALVRDGWGLGCPRS